MDVVAVRAAIADTLGQLDIRVYGYVPDSPHVPCVIVYPRPFEYAASFDGTEHPSFALWCVGGFINEESAQQTLDAWISSSGPNSIVRLVGSDSTLGGRVPSAVITRLENYAAAPIQEGGPRYLQATLLLDVYV